MRIVFLECDGVLNCCTTDTHIPNTPYVGLDMELVKNLKTLIDKSNEEEETKIVLSSSWRKNLVRSQAAGNDYDESGDNALPYLKETLKKVDLEIFDYTPYFGHNNFDYSNQRYAGRGDEILQWIEDHKDLNITNYLILDDEYHHGFDDIIDHWIKTKFYSDEGGFREEYIDPALEVLRGNWKNVRYGFLKSSSSSEDKN